MATTMVKISKPTAISEFNETCFFVIYSISKTAAIAIEFEIRIPRTEPVPQPYLIPLN